MKLAKQLSKIYLLRVRAITLGGMVGVFKPLAEPMQFIVAGNLESRNDRDDNLIFGAVAVMMCDLTQRVRFDPAAIFAAGFSGGGRNSYEFARRFGYLVAGVMPLGGWLGGKASQTVWQEYTPGLLVARLTGKKDHAARSWLKSDLEHLQRYGATVLDIPYEGGHAIPPEHSLEEGIKWLLVNRPASLPGDEQKARAEYAAWQSMRNAKGAGHVLEECFQACKQTPRSWRAFWAHRMISEILRDPQQLRSHPPTRLGEGQASAIYFGYLAESAILTGDRQTAESALFCLRTVEKLDSAWFVELHRAIIHGPENRVQDATLMSELSRLYWQATGHALPRQAEKDSAAQAALPEDNPAGTQEWP